MDDLILLVKLIQGSKFKSKAHLSLLLEPQTQMRKLYDALAAGGVTSDEELLLRFPEFNNTKTALATLKSKLKDRLSEAVLFLDINDGDASNRQKAYVDCLKKWAVGGVLLSKNYRQLGIEKLEHLLRYSKRFEFTEISIEVLQALRLQSSVIYGNELQYRDYSDQLEQCQAIRTAEDKAEACYLELMIRFGSSRSNKREMAEFAQKLFEDVEPSLSKYTSYRLHLFGRLIQISIFDNQNDYKKVIQLCTDAIEFFDQKPYKSFNGLQVFYYSLIMSYLNLHQYNRCRIIGNCYESLFTKGNYNWYKWKELHFLAEMHAGEYEAAAGIWQAVSEQQKVGELIPQIGESWAIYEAFLVFLSNCGQLKDKKTDKSFKVNKMLNDLHVFQRDKSGMNIPILVIQYLLAISEKKFGLCIDRQESMAKYRTRYLSVSEAGRSHYFFRMLELIPKAGFEQEETRQKAAPLLAKLSAFQLTAANQNFEVEIIPYETLWNLILSCLSLARQKPESFEHGMHKSVVAGF